VVQGALKLILEPIFEADFHRLNPTIEELTAAIEQEAEERPEVLRLINGSSFGT
jgi:hypothetical protein